MSALAAPSHSKVSRTEWLDAALEVLRNDGIAQVSVLALAQRLGVQRSSFYWYFKSRGELVR